MSNEIFYINTIINDDWKNVLKDVGDNIVDMVITDPPYGINFRSNHRTVKHKSIYNDNTLDWLKEWCIEVSRVCKKDAHLYIFCSWHNIDIFKSVVGNYFNIKNILIWEKNNTGMGDLKGDYAPKYEMILFCSNGVKKLNGGRDPNILKFKRTRNKSHPTEKPVDLLSYLIKKSSNEDDVILDTFAGSFSTAKACLETNRNFLCMEIDEDYCKQAKKQILNIKN